LLVSETETVGQGGFVMRNVGSTERFVRVGIGVVAAIAAARASGWSRAALNTLATAGFATGLTRYCPLNQAVGRDSSHQLSPLDAELPASGSRL
jgi:Inner membrane protein YgaP-like, transmembrane domain